MTDNTNNKRKRIVICGKGGGMSTVTWDDIQDKPEFATVATSGDYDDLTDKPTIPAAPVQSDWNEADSTSLAYIANKPTIPAAQVNSDWNASSGVEQILNKPTLATVATSGSYNDLTDKPTIPTVPTNVSAFTNDAGYLTQHQSLAGYATENWVQQQGYSTFDGDYNSLSNKPSIPAAQVNSDWNASSGVAQILNKPTIPTKTSDLTNDSGFTTFSGDYNDLTNKPTIPAAQVNSDWNASSGVEQILNKPTLATVATSGDYDDLINKPTIPAAPVQSNWNESDSTSLAYIQNKPTIPAAQVNADWNSNSGVSQILNKPAMTTETLTFTLQGGTTQTITVYTQPTI